MKYQSFRADIRLFIIFLCLPFSFSNVYASDAKSLCIVSLLHESHLNKEIPKRVNALLSRLGHKKEVQNNNLFDYYGNLQGPLSVYNSLKNCLEGGHEEIAIIGHSKKNIIGQTLLQYTNTKKGEQYILSHLDDRFFKNITPSSNLKQILLIGCDSHELMKFYPNLEDLVSNYGLKLKHAPVSHFWSMVKGVKNLRHSGDAIKLLAESAQPGNATYTYCYVNFQSNAIYSCLRGAIEIKSLKVDDKEKSYWLRVVKNKNGAFKVDTISPWHRVMKRKLSRGNSLILDMQKEYKTLNYKDKDLVLYFNP